MKVTMKQEVEIKIAYDEVKNILIDAAPRRFIGWFFTVEIQENGDAVLTGTQKK